MHQLQDLVAKLKSQLSSGVVAEDSGASGSKKTDEHKQKSKKGARR